MLDPNPLHHIVVIRYFNGIKEKLLYLGQVDYVRSNGLNLCKFELNLNL